MALQPKSPLLGTQLRINLALKLSPSKTLLGLQEFRTNHATICMAASSDSSRRRPRKSAIPKTKTPAPKGFPSKSQAGTSTQKKDKRDIEEKVIGEIGETEVDLQSSIPSNTVKRRVEILEKLEENDDGNNTLSSGITSTAFSNDESDSQLVEYKDVEGKKGLKHKELMGVQQSWGDTIR